MPAPDIIQDLVARFDRNREAYRSGRYNETQIMCASHQPGRDEPFNPAKSPRVYSSRSGRCDARYRTHCLERKGTFRKERMPKHQKDPRLEALEKGQSITWKVPEGGDLASMRNTIKHGQSLTFEPVVNTQDIRVGDIVYLKWHNSHIMHLVQEIQWDQFLIVNSLGKINGWVKGSDILGRVTQVIDPEPQPGMNVMLGQLETAYHQLIEQTHPKEDEAHRLLSVTDDLRWYAGRIGAERWDKIPRSNKWSFEQNVWYFTRQARDAIESAQSPSIRYLIDRGKACVGLAAEILALFEYGESY